MESATSHLRVADPGARRAVCANFRPKIRVRYGQTNSIRLGPCEAKPCASALLNASIVSASFNELEDGHHLVLEIAAPNPTTPADVIEIEERIASQLGVPYQVLLRPVPDSVVSNSGYTTWDKTLAHFARRTAEHYAEETEHMLEVWQ